MQEFVSLVSPLLLVGAKGGVLIFLGLYILFSVVMVRQVGIMTKTLELGLEAVIGIFAYLHLILAVSIFFISLYML